MLGRFITKENLDSKFIRKPESRLRASGSGLGWRVGDNVFLKSVLLSRAIVHFMIMCLALVCGVVLVPVQQVRADSCSLALNASPDSIGPDQSSGISLSSSPQGALSGGTMTASGNSSSYSFSYSGGTSATITAAHYPSSGGVTVRATGWKVTASGVTYDCSDASTSVAVGGGVTNCQLNSQGPDFLYVNQVGQVEVSSNVPVTGWQASVSGAGSGGATSGGQYGIFVGLQAGNVTGTINVDVSAIPLNSSGTCRSARHQIAVLAQGEPPPPPGPNPPPPPGGGCPAGATPSLVSSTIPVGGQTNVSPPVGWSSGGLFSQDTSVATITVTGGGWVVTGVSSGTAAIYGTNWSASNNAWPCNLDNVYITVGVAAPGDTAPIGYVTSADTAGSNCWVGGWAYDPDTPAQSIVGHVYVNGPAGSGTYIGMFNVDQPNAAVNDAFGITGNHGFAYTIPNAYRDGASHTFYVYSINTSGGPPNPQMTNYTPTGVPDPLTLTCAPTATPTAQLWVSLHNANNWVKSLTVTPATSLDYKWSSTNGSSYDSLYQTTPNATWCGNPPSGSWIAGSASGQYLDAVVSACQAGYSFVLTYRVNGGVATDSVSVIVTNGSAPTLSLSANNFTSPPTVHIDQGTPLTLAWTIGGGAPTSCVPTSSPLVSAWNNTSKGTASGSQVLNSLSVDTYTFNLSCSNSVGVANAAVTVQVHSAPPQAASLINSNHDLVGLGQFSNYLSYDYQINADANPTGPIGDGDLATLAVHIRNTGSGSVSGNVTLAVDLFNLGLPKTAGGWNAHIYCGDSSLSVPSKDAPTTCNGKYNLGGDASSCAANTGQPAYNAATHRLTFVLCPVGGQVLEGSSGMNLLSVRYTAQVQHPAGSAAGIFRFKAQGVLTYTDSVNGATTLSGLYLDTKPVLVIRNLRIPYLLEH